MFCKNRFLSKFACGLLCLTLAMPGQTITSLAQEVPGEVASKEQQEMGSQETITDSDAESTDEVPEDETLEDVPEEKTEDISEGENTEEAVKDELSEETTSEEDEDAKEDPGEESEDKDVIDIENLPEIKGDYYRQYASTLYAGKEISCSDETVSFSVDEGTSKLIVSGEKDALLSGEISIEKTFSFDGKCVGRFAFEASTPKGQRITLGFYLDDNEEPFVTKDIVRQRKKNTWAYEKEFSADTLGLNLTGEHTLKIKVLDASDSNPSFSLNWFEFVESSVPVIYFDINESEGSIGEMNSSEDHSAECYGSMSIKVPEGYTSVDTGKVLTGGDYNLEYIRGRGNSTWGTGKNPYKLKLEDSSKLLGMGKNKHWILLANYYDNSLLRNRMTYWLGKQLGMAYTPSMEPVDLVMNGEYYGSYFLCEQIRVDKNRVNIKDLEKTPDETDEANITGGYLLSMFPYKDEPTKAKIKTKQGVEYLLESPEFDGYENAAQLAYITNYIQKLEDAIYSNDFKTEDGVPYTELMDLRSTALYYWIQEFSMNGDGYISGSTYLYKPENDKLYWGPLWDFDYVAWGSTEYDGFITEGWCHNGENGYSTNWNGRLFEDAEFAREVVQTWEELKPLLQQLTAPGGQLDLYAADMDITARYNFEKLGPSPIDDSAEEAPDLNYDQEITRLKNWIDQRLEWVDNNVAKLEPVETTVTFKDDKGNVIATRTGIVGKKLRDIPNAPEKKGYTFDGWEYTYIMNLDFILQIHGCKTEEELRAELLEEGMTKAEVDDFIETYKKGEEVTGFFDRDTSIEENMVLNATYINNNDIVRAKKIYLDKAVYRGIYYGNENGGYFSAPVCQVTPFYAYDGDVTFTTDNENIVRFDEFNDPEVMGAGECTLIARTSLGVEATAKIKIYTEDEADGMDELYDSATWYVEEKATVKKGYYYQLKFDCSNELAVFGDSPLLVSTDESIVEVGSAGVIHALRAGTAYVVCISDDNVCTCKITVPAAPGSVGTTVVRNGVKYKVTVNKAKSKKVTCIGPAKTTIKKAVIPATIKINGKQYRVTNIKASAFKNCKKLTSVSIGKYVEIIGKYAFQGCKKLTKITIYASQPKIYASSFKYVPKKAVYSVPKKSKNYFEIVLKGKKIVTHN